MWFKLLTRSHFKFCFRVNVFKMASSGHWLLAVFWHAVQNLQQRVIIYCKDQHSSQCCCNWKLHWSCKYSTLFFAVREGISVFPHLAYYRHYSPGLLSGIGSVTPTAPKLAVDNTEKTRIQEREGDILFHAQLWFPVDSLDYSSGRSIEHQQMPLRNGQQHILFTTSWK